MRPRVRAVLLAAGAALLLFRLGSPALWQDEAETALRAESVLESGFPRSTTGGSLVTAQSSLAVYESNAAGVWTWNTWLPVYAAAASLGVLGRTPLAARLPFALAGLLTLWLLSSLFAGEEAAAALPASVLLLLCPAFLLFCRQSRYYALTALGAVLVMLAWRALLAGRRGAGLALAAALQVLLHSLFAWFAIATLALLADAALRGRACRARRFAVAAGAAAALALPVCLWFRVWDRPGNHLYALAESFEFLKTFLLWIALFSLPPLLLAARALKERLWPAVGAGFLLLCGLCAEGALSRVAAAAAFGWLAAAAVRSRGLERLCWLWLASSLLLLSLFAAEPYGRYLAGALPALAIIGGLRIAELARGDARRAFAAAVLLSAANWAARPLVAAASLLAGPAAPAETVSGMMRQRLRDVPLRSDLALFSRELVRGPQGYVERAAGVVKAGGGGTAFSDADVLSLMFAAGVKPVYKDDLGSVKPDWILPSPWLRLDPRLSLSVSALAAGAEYELVPVSAPRLLWQNNPDPLFRDYAPKTGPLPLYRKRH